LHHNFSKRKLGGTRKAIRVEVIKILKTMKRIFFLFRTATLILLFFNLSSCENSSSDVKLNELNSSCDYVNTTNNILDQIINLRGEKTDEQLTTEEKIKLEEWQVKLKQIGKAGNKKYTQAEFKECPNYENLMNKINASQKNERADALARANEAMKKQMQQIKEDSIKNSESNNK
jgi:hypothetical protein